MTDSPSGSWASFPQRLFGALRLDGGTYRAVARDPAALSQSIAVILLSSLASAIVFLIDGASPGLSVDVDWESYPITRDSNAAAALAGGILDASWGLIVWAVQAAIIWFLWNRFAARDRHWHEIATPLGFANVPLILFAFLELVPVIGGGLGVIGLLWMVVASVVAVKQGLETGWGWAVAMLTVSILVLWPLSYAVSIAV